MVKGWWFADFRDVFHSLLSWFQHSLPFKQMAGQCASITCKVTGRVHGHDALQDADVNGRSSGEMT